MSIHINVRMSKIMHTPIKVGGCIYVTYANCRTLVPMRFFISEGTVIQIEKALINDCLCVSKVS